MYETNAAYWLICRTEGCAVLEYRIGEHIQEACPGCGKVGQREPDGDA